MYRLGLAAAFLVVAAACRRRPPRRRRQPTADSGAGVRREDLAVHGSRGPARHHSHLPRRRHAGDGLLFRDLPPGALGSPRRETDRLAGRHGAHRGRTGRHDGWAAAPSVEADPGDQGRAYVPRPRRSSVPTCRRCGSPSSRRGATSRSGIEVDGDAAIVRTPDEPTRASGPGTVSGARTVHAAGATAPTGKGRARRSMKSRWSWRKRPARTPCRARSSRCAPFSHAAAGGWTDAPWKGNGESSSKLSVDRPEGHAYAEIARRRRVCRCRSRGRSRRPAQQPAPDDSREARPHGGDSRRRAAARHARAAAGRAGRGSGRVGARQLRARPAPMAAASRTTRAGSSTCWTATTSHRSTPTSARCSRLRFTAGWRAGSSAFPSIPSSRRTGCSTPCTASARWATPRRQTSSRRASAQPTSPTTT